MLFAHAHRTPVCHTQIADTNPPANVRAAPNDIVLTTLPNGTLVVTDDDRGGWLHLTDPVLGWVSYKVTRVDCGPEHSGATARAIAALGKFALTDRSAADTLVRFAMHADGGSAAAAASALSAVMTQNPTLLISVLDELPDDARRETLTGAAVSLGAFGAFDRAISANPDHPTAATWRAMSDEDRTAGFIHR